MFVCLKCKSNKIKTRSNGTSGRKSTTVAVSCKSCGSTDIHYVESRKRDFKKK